MTRTAALAPLREPGFRWYFSSRLVNLAGTTMAPVALAFAVLHVSDSAGSLGLVLAAHSIPQVVFLLLGGVVADRLGRTLVIQLSNVGAALSQACSPCCCCRATPSCGTSWCCPRSTARSRR